MITFLQRFKLRLFQERKKNYSYWFLQRINKFGGRFYSLGFSKKVNKKKVLKNLASIEVAIRDERKSEKEVDLRKSEEQGRGLASNGSGLWLLS